MPEIVVKVDGLFRRPQGKVQRRAQLRQRVAKVILEVINRVLRPQIPECILVEVIVETFDHIDDEDRPNGFARWSAEPVTTS